MKILGIVAEYNPFHNGHKYHIDAAKEIVNPDAVFCVMSGNFVQRGEPAIYNKFIRANCAVNNGIDIVFELPLFASLSSAENFAMQAISILNNAGVTHLAFGCENDDIKLLDKIANIIVEESDKYKELLKVNLKKGVSYPKAREIAISEIISRDNGLGGNPPPIINDVLKSPNNILAIEYLKSLKKLKSNIIPVPIKRYKTDYHSLETTDNIASASAIRNMIKLKSDISKFVPEIINKKTIFVEDFEQMLMYKLRSSTKEDFLSLQDVNEGLENAFINAVTTSITLNEIIEKVNSKRYTLSRIKRILFNLLLEVPKDNQLVYLRILACSLNGKKFLPFLSQTSSLPIVTSINRFLKNANEKQTALIKKEIYATNIYSIINNNPFNLDIKNKI